jgi:two-component system NtrC family sensor kinase
MKSNPPTSESFNVISSLAHELDSPLKSILTRTKKLINDYKNRDFEFISFKDFKVIISTLEQVERQLEHCSRTTSRMLYVGKRHARMEENNYQVNDVIKSVSDLLSHQLKSARIKLVMRLLKQLPLVTVGPIECYQIINNVIINAIQAMPGGGVIKVRTSLDKTHGFVGIEITDEGVGITPDHLSKVFEPFFTTKERGIDKSSGLGLSITHSIISAAGGSIHIKSSLRRGTTVQISLPVYQPQ